MRSPRRSAASSLRRSRRPTQERAAALLPRVRRYASEWEDTDVESLRFRFDGVVLCDEQTAADVGLESGDQIDCSLIYWNGEEA